MLNAVDSRGGRMNGLLALFIYAVCIFALQACVVLAEMFPFIPKQTSIVAYFVLGFVLNRTVLRGMVKWHAMTNTLPTVTNSKVVALVFWPFFYAHLLFRIFLNWLL